jgi:hypothetical protein
MKKILLYTAILISGLFFITSCEKEEIGGTSTVAMAGEWYVTGIAVDADGNVVYGDDDLFGLGHFHLDTYNTADNNSTEMWIDDNENFWEFKAKISVDLNTMTFQAAEAQNEYYDMQVTVSEGKIIPGAATTPSGMPADSIVFLVNFSDDTYPEDFGFASYRIAGYRYTGFSLDD